jgi:hypothetical protein
MVAAARDDWSLSVVDRLRYAIGFSPIAPAAPTFTPDMVVCALPPIVIVA